MEIARAIEVLEALRSGTDPRTSAEEELALDNLSAVTITGPEQRAELETGAADLERLRAKVLDARRAVDLLWGPKSPRFGAPGRSRPSSKPTPLQVARSQLQDAVRELEARSLSRTALAALVASSVTGTWLSLSLQGRQQLQDLKVWGPRLGAVELDRGLGRIADVRATAINQVRNAAAIEDTLDSVELNRLRKAAPASVRAGALILSLAGTPASDSGVLLNRISYFLSHFPHSATSPEDQLVGAILLDSLRRPDAETSAAYRSIQRQLAEGPLAASRQPAQLDLLAAAVLGYSVGTSGDLVARANEVAGALPGLPPLALAALVGSPYPTGVLVDRLRAGEDALTRVGYPPEDIVRAASAVLAGSRSDPASWAPSIAALDPTLRGLFPTAIAADALLASTGLAPPEALQLLGECAGAVSRALYFSDTPEVDYLALLLATGLSGGGAVGAIMSGAQDRPMPVPEAGDPPIEAGGTGAGDPSVGQYSGASFAAIAGGGMGVLAVLYLTHSYWMMRAYNEYTRQHPLHSNAVPVYG